MKKKLIRQDAIYNYLVNEGQLSITTLAEKLTVTPMTIRRDLNAMANAGLVKRMRGGCIIKSPMVQESHRVKKSKRQHAQKVAIAREVVKRFKSGDSIYLDSGTTVQEVGRALPAGLKLDIVTNNVKLVSELFGREELTVIVLGGQLGENNPYLIGEASINRIREFYFDWAIIGADALYTSQAELYNANASTAALNRSAHKQADKTVAVVDSSKFGKCAKSLVGRLTDGITLITDSDGDDDDYQKLHELGVDFVCVSTP